VYPSFEHFPAGERTAYTGAAVIMATDALTASSPAAKLFLPSLVTD